MVKNKEGHRHRVRKVYTEWIILFYTCYAMDLYFDVWSVRWMTLVTVGGDTAQGKTDTIIHVPLLTNCSGALWETHWVELLAHTVAIEAQYAASIWSQTCHFLCEHAILFEVYSLCWGGVLLTYCSTIPRSMERPHSTTDSMHTRATATSKVRRA